MGQSPANMLNHSPMSQLQIVAVIICIALNALDGFDVLAISFASPGIAAEWGINRAELGVVLAMEMFGMALGSVILGNAADRFGRKPTIQFCLILMTSGMFLAAMVDTVNHLLMVRFLTGLGIGGMLASTNAMVAEFANQKFRHLCVIIMATGYPLGAIAGGSVVSVLLETHTWRSIFVFGGSVTAMFLVIVAWLLPESVEYLSNKQPANALQRINATLTRMGHQGIVQLPEKVLTVKKSSFKILLSKDLRVLTLLLMLAYFAQIMTFYFILKWIPKFVVDMGFAPAQAGQVLVWANVGGAIGAILLGLLTHKIKLHKLLIGVLLIAFVMVSVFGRGYESLSSLAMVSAATGFFTNAGVVGLYALMAQSFPSDVRASGTGVVIGFGRGGAAISPIVAGYLFTAGVSLQGVSIAMGTGALVAALSIFCIGIFQHRTSNKKSLSTNKKSVI
ncbi:MFS transporter [Alteromonas sp. 38]|uniref:MFS transporter n=1 Tax=Alteromonas TaxID=226 RepID=UPI0012F37D6A|nr:MULTISPECIES: MFS transporter [Alteromonas]CAD5282562.1 MFS transporter [Alteromonas sp. 154]VXB89733.1 MFS transporter [Alteromonas sp. 38]